MVNAVDHVRQVESLEAWQAALSAVHRAGRSPGLGTARVSPADRLLVQRALRSRARPRMRFVFVVGGIVEGVVDNLPGATIPGPRLVAP